MHLYCPEHLSSPPILSVVRVTWSLIVFCVMFCRLLFVLSSFFFCHCIVLRFTDSDYPFGIYKLILSFWCDISPVLDGLWQYVGVGGCCWRGLHLVILFPKSYVTDCLRSLTTTPLPIYGDLSPITHIKCSDFQIPTNRYVFWW